jgi:hypothetical protein
MGTRLIQSCSNRAAEAENCCTRRSLFEDVLGLLVPTWQIMPKSGMRLLGIVYTSVYKMSKCGKQLPNKAIHNGRIANPSVPRTDIAKSVSYTYGESTHGFSDDTAC